MTPSILRLARRPGQDAVDDLRRLTSVADMGHAETRPGPRPEDAAEMDNAVAWGSRVIGDTPDNWDGCLKWAGVDRGRLLSGAPGCPQVPGQGGGKEKLAPGSD